MFLGNVPHQRLMGKLTCYGSKRKFLWWVILLVEKLERKGTKKSSGFHRWQGVGTRRQMRSWAAVLSAGINGLGWRGAARTQNSPTA